MRIESIRLCGFRCFSAAGQKIAFDALTCFVGPNASGKTAAMTALARLFGENQGERVVKHTDFHLLPGERLDAAPERTLSIEVRLAFPTHTCARRAATRQQRARRAHDERNLSRPSLSWRELAIHLVGCGHRKGSTRHRTQAGWTAGVAYFTYPLRKVGGFRVSAPATPSTRGPQILGSSSKSNTRRCFQR